MAEELALDLEELRHLQSIAKRSRIINHLNLLSKHLLFSEILSLDNESQPQLQSSQSQKKQNEESKSTVVTPQIAAKKEAVKQEKQNNSKTVPLPRKNPNRFSVSMTVPQYVKKYEGLRNGEYRNDITESLAGQIMNKRSSSSFFFYYLRTGGSQVQIVADPSHSDMDESEFSRFHSYVRRGDFIGVTGFPGKTNRGELSIFPRSFITLSYCPDWKKNISQPSDHKMSHLTFE